MYQRVAGAKKKITNKSASKTMASDPITILEDRLACYMIILSARSLLQPIQHVLFYRKIINL